MGIFDKQDQGAAKTAMDDNDFLTKESFSADGFEDINVDTMSVPFIKIANKLSPALDEHKSEYIEGLKEGQFYNSVTNEIYGNELEVIVLRYEHMYVEWKPNRGGFVDFHTPENAEALAYDRTFGKWKTEEGNELSENYTYLVLIVGKEAEGPHVIVLSSTNIKSAQKWNRMLITHVMENGKKASPYFLRWTISTDYTSNEKGAWYGFKVKPAQGIYINKAQFEVALKEREALPSRRVDYSQLDAGESAKQISDGSESNGQKFETKF